MNVKTLFNSYETYWYYCKVLIYTYSINDIQLRIPLFCYTSVHHFPEINNFPNLVFSFLIAIKKN
jgi:hypothetical protein